MTPYTRSVALAVALCSASLAGCGGDSPPPSAPDAGPPGPDASTPFSPLAPQAPTPPTLGPCATGWRALADGTCDPWPTSGHASCGAGEAHFTGEPGCVRVGSPCPADGLPADLPAGTTAVFVHASAAPGGEGTRASPFARIADALRGAPAGAIIAIGAGTYDEAVAVRSGLTLWGACTELTTIRAPSATDLVPTIDVLGRDVGIRNLTITGARPGIVSAPGVAATVRIEDVIITGARVAGVVIAASGTSTATGLVVRDMQAGDAGNGRGIDVENGGRFEVRRALVERAIEFGVFARADGAFVLLEDVAILETMASAVTDFGRGLRLQEAAIGEARRIVLERNTDIAVSVSRPGTMLVLEDAVVRDVRPGTDGRFDARGIDLAPGASAIVRRALFERLGDVALFAGGAGAMLMVEDVIVRDVDGRETDGSGGRGASVQDGATLSLVRVRIERVQELGIHATSPVTMLSLEDVSIADVSPQPVGDPLGRGLQLDDGAVATVARLAIDRVVEAGFVASGEGTILDASDVRVSDTASRAEDQLLGRAMHAQLGASVSLSRARFERNLEVSAVVSLDAQVDFSDVDIADSLERACAATTCATYPGGIGLAVYMRASVRMTRFAISGVPLAAVQLASEAQVDLDHGRIERAVIGANVQIADYDLQRLATEVQYIDVTRTIDASRLPVPDPSGALSGP